jgi:DNA polymerase
MTTLWLDCESYSECDLKKAGTHAYAAHPSTEIMVVQWALDDGEPTVHDCTEWKAMDLANPPLELELLLEDPTVEIVAHNSMFDRTLIRHCWGIDVPVERWRDTMVAALAHGLPGALGKLGPVLGIPEDQQKDKRGRELIQLFCKPRPKNQTLRRANRATHPKEWAEFVAYSRQDIPAMREVHRRLPVWNYRGGELDLWHLDQRINDRGFAVDLDLARAAIAATEREKARLKDATQDATDGLVDGPSKRDQLLAFILAEHGVDLPDMKADTLRRRMEDPELPDAVKLLIAIRLEATKTSTAKYKALEAAASPDGRLRNTLQFAGAQRTGRWAGRIFQPQNMPRPSNGFDEELQDLGIAALKEGYADAIGMDAMQLTADCIRGAIVAPEGKKLVVADLSNIEGRMLAFLAGEEWKLQAFRDFDAGVGEDLYKLAYARSFNVEPKTATGQKRQIGKVMELALGYEGGVAAFLTFAAVYRMDLAQLTDAVHLSAPKNALAAAYGIHDWAQKKGRNTFGLGTSTYVACEALKAMWREAHPATQALWKAAQDGVRDAIANPGVTFDIGEHLKARKDGAWLRLRLPSGRYLCYLQPKVGEKGEITYMGVNQYTRQWGRIKTYGGKLIENATQAAARDVMAAAMPTVEWAGFDIVLTVHDELITEAVDGDRLTHRELAALMSQVPAWAPGLPLAAAGFETYRYRKD